MRRWRILLYLVKCMVNISRPKKKTRPNKCQWMRSRNTNNTYTYTTCKHTQTQRLNSKTYGTNYVSFHQTNTKTTKCTKKNNIIFITIANSLISEPFFLLLCSTKLLRLNIPLFCWCAYAACINTHKHSKAKRTCTRRTI